MAYTKYLIIYNFPQEQQENLIYLEIIYNFEKIKEELSSYKIKLHVEEDPLATEQIFWWRNDRITESQSQI